MWIKAGVTPTLRATALMLTFCWLRCKSYSAANNAARRPSVVRVGFFSTDIDKITLLNLRLAELLDGASQVGSAYSTALGQ